MAGKKRLVGSRESVVGSRESIVGSRQSVVGSREPKTPLELDRLIHERLRLGIVSALAVNERLAFNDLKRLLRTTDGNLSVHARKLEEAGYLTCLKAFEGRMPKTEFELTEAGQRALQKYLDHMEAIIRHARSKTRP